MFQYYMQNCTLTYRNRQLFATFCYKCSVKSGFCVFLESLYLLQVHEKTSKRAFRICFLRFLEKKNDAFCAFL